LSPCSQRVTGPSQPQYSHRRGFLHRAELPHWPMIKPTAIVSTLPQIAENVIARMETLYAWPRFAFQAILGAYIEMRGMANCGR
jgi:hypothetical protein